MSASKIITKLKFKNLLLLGVLLIVIIPFGLIGKLSGGKLGVNKLIGASSVKAQCWTLVTLGGGGGGIGGCAATGASSSGCTSSSC